MQFVYILRVNFVIDAPLYQPVSHIGIQMLVFKILILAFLRLAELRNFYH